MRRRRSLRSVAYDDAGMVTAEAAVVLPVLVLVLALCLGGIATGIAQMRCVDAARAGARALARGDSTAQAVELARAAAPAGASIDVDRQPNPSAGTVVVQVHGRVSLLGGWGGHLLSLPVGATATAPLESAVPAP